MAGLSSSRSEPSTGNRRSGGLVWVLVVVLTVGATGALVVSNDARLLRLAIIGALWAALIGAFIAAGYRRSIKERGESAEHMQRVYELELEREVAARREYELELEAETRRRVTEEVRAEAADDLAALRAELRALRENLESLLGGELLVERVALHAEHTRMRALGDQPRSMLAAAREGRRRGIVAGAIGGGANSGALNGGALNGTAVNGAAANGAVSAVPGVAAAASAAAVPDAAEAEPRTELLRPVSDLAEQPREAARPERRREPRPGRGGPIRLERTPGEPARPAAGPQTSRRDLPPPDAQPTTLVPTVLAGSNPPPARPDLPAAGGQGEQGAESWSAHTWEQAAGTRGGSRLDRGRRDLPPDATSLVRAPQPPADPHRAAEQHPDQHPGYPADQYPADQYAGDQYAGESYAADRYPAERYPGAEQSGRAVRQRLSEQPPPGPAADPPSQHGMRPASSEDTGAHANGRSVSDLLAAHGDGEPRRRRRRRSD